MVKCTVNDLSFDSKRKKNTNYDAFELDFDKRTIRKWETEERYMLNEVITRKNNNDKDDIIHFILWNNILSNGRYDLFERPHEQFIIWQNKNCVYTLHYITI